jgi:hypothetical protein
VFRGKHAAMAGVGFFGRIEGSVFHLVDAQDRGGSDNLLHAGGVVDARQLHQDFVLGVGPAVLLDDRLGQTQRS